MSAFNPLGEIIREMHFRSQEEFGRELGWSASKTSRVVNKRILPTKRRKEVVLYLQTTKKEVPARVWELIGEDLSRETELPPGRNTSRQKTGWEPPAFEPIEHAAFSWALSFRNSALLEELGGQALRNGLGCSRFMDSIEFLPRIKGAGRASAATAGRSLFPEPSGFGLHAGTVLMLGAAQRHQESLNLLERFSKLLGQSQKTCVIRQFYDRPSYFGYQSVLKLMEVGGRIRLHPQRYAESESVTVFEDAAAIFHGPFERLYPRKNTPFSAAARRIILVAALQRLANGLAVRLLADTDFREFCVGVPDFEESAEADVLVFRVRATNDDYGTVIRLLQVIDARNGKVVRSVPAKEVW